MDSKIPLLQAHRGVSSDYPENTMRAFLGAAEQGYAYIECDPAVTLDGKVVLLHDKTLNRTARALDGRIIEAPLSIADITYAETRAYDMGSYISKKYKNERIPLLSDLLSMALEHGITVKLDNKIERFTVEQKTCLYEIINQSDASVGFTVTSVESAKEVLARCPDCELHYDGDVTLEALEALSSLAPRERLVVWLPFRNANTAWVKCAYATPMLCHTVKRYARLGLWLINSFDEFDIAADWGADIVETDGQIKPIARRGVISDTHLHSEFSHDSKCPVEEIAIRAIEKGIDIVCVTDHCDIVSGSKPPLPITELKAVRMAVKKEVEKTHARYADAVSVLCGIELGENFWNPERAATMMEDHHYDAVIGSVHLVHMPNHERAYSGIDFTTMSEEELDTYLMCYFTDIKEMLATMDCDIMAHLTCPLRYINGIAHRNVDCHRYETVIREILQMLIQKKIALEVNTSCLGGGYDAFMPEEWIVSLYREMGGHLITCGSDAHVSERLGWGFERLFEMLKRQGFRYICYWKERTLYQCTLA